ncbi:MAG: hypothetical protein NZM25_10520 [Leptospiraceae bacterium]|nr:hypothetical protein [Leptospiraceae bacterium]MDW8305861.1 hypothetical protein [Leptospiraceae bacterium]
MSSLILFLLLFISLIIWLLTPLIPLKPAAFLLLVQFFFTLLAFILWRRRRKKGKPAFLRAFLLAAHFLFLVATTAVIMYVNVKDEQEGDSLGFMRGLGKMIFRESHKKEEFTHKDLQNREMNKVVQSQP